MFQEALSLFEDGQLSKAIMQMKMAVAFEPDNQFFADQLALFEERLAGPSKPEEPDEALATQEP